MSAYNDVEFCVDIDELALFVDNGQRRNSFVDKFSEGLDDGHGVMADFDVFVAPDAEVVDGLGEVFGLRQVVNL